MLITARLFKGNINKKVNIHKNEVQEIRWPNEYIDKNRVPANITEYYIISKLIFLRIIVLNTWR